MHILIILLAVTLGIALPNIALADDFGARFYNQAPKGLGDYTAPESEIPDIAMDDMAEDLQNIMPAAGEEENAEAVIVEEILEE